MILRRAYVALARFRQHAHHPVTKTLFLNVNAR
jgi:hypothetical protein